MPDDTGARTGDNEAHEHVELKGRAAARPTSSTTTPIPTIAAWVEKHNRYAVWEAAMYERFLSEPSRPRSAAASDSSAGSRRSISACPCVR